MLNYNSYALRALAKQIGCKPSEINQDDWWILTDKEATEKCKEYIEETLWAFNPEFLASHSDIDPEVFRALSDKMYEDSSPYIKKMLHDWDDFVEDAIACDGRGHFLSSYDGNEIELGKDLYAYKIN